MNTALYAHHEHTTFISKHNLKGPELLKLSVFATMHDMYTRYCFVVFQLWVPLLNNCINLIYLLFTLHMPFMYVYIYIYMCVYMYLILDIMSNKLAIRQMDKLNKLVWVWIVWCKGVHRLRSAHSWRNSLLHLINMLWTHPWRRMSCQFMSHRNTEPFSQSSSPFQFTSIALLISLLQTWQRMHLKYT